MTALGARGRSSAVRVSIVEDEGLMRELLSQSISQHAALRVVHAVPSVRAARRAIVPGSTDVVLLDISLEDGNGLTLGVQLQRADPDLAVLLLSAQDHLALFSAMREDMPRPWSYLSKRSTLSLGVLARAVLATARGEVVIDPALVERSAPRQGSQVSRLTVTQLQVLRMVAQGLSNHTIADRMEISSRSVESHLRSIYRRLELEDDIHNRRVSAVLTFLDQTGRHWEQ